MNSIKVITILSIIFGALIRCEAKVTHAKTEVYKVWGNCNLCKKTIEKAAKKSGEAKGDWNQETKMITITYDSTKTNSDAILKRIAEAGYDNDKFIASDISYNKRPECCRYKRKPNVSAIISSGIQIGTQKDTAPKNQTIETKSMPSNLTDVRTQIKSLLTIYYQLKDALVGANNKVALANTKEFERALSNIETQKMTATELTFFTTIKEKLLYDTGRMISASSIDKMREHFSAFSKNMLSIVKHFNANEGSPVYYDYCPMYNNGKGANWLSNESVIKNPYYGSQMLNCGSVQETIGNTPQK